MNYTYKNEPALWQLDDTYDGFDWIDFHAADNSVVSFLRKSHDGHIVAFVVNATSVVRYDYRLGVPESGFYRELINTDGEAYGGSNVGNFGGVQTQDVLWMGRQYSILIHLPSLATLAFKLQDSLVSLNLLTTAVSIVRTDHFLFLQDSGKGLSTRGWPRHGLSFRALLLHSSARTSGIKRYNP